MGRIVCVRTRCIKGILPGMLIDLPPLPSSAPLHPLPSLLSTELQGLSIISLSHSKISKEAMHIHITRVLHREVIFFPSLLHKRSPL